MNNEEIKTALQKLYEGNTDFTVVQSGRASKRVNGLYKPDTHEIIIHNKNFKNDNELLFTAIHELTHHIMTDAGVKSVRCHSGAFWPTFYDLIDKAVNLGIYSRKRSEETENLIRQAKEIQQKIIELQKELGNLISQEYKICEQNGERIEDVINHDLQMTKTESKTLTALAGSGAPVSGEMQKAIQSAKDEMLKHKAEAAAADGKTVEQVKSIAKAKAVDDGLDSVSRLEKEKKRLEHTIDQLNRRYEEVSEQLEGMMKNDNQ